MDGYIDRLTTEDDGGGGGCMSSCPHSPFADKLKLQMIDLHSCVLRQINTADHSGSHSDGIHPQNDVTPTQDD